MHKKNIRDHAGHSYNSIKEMCDAYQIPYSVYQKRIEHKWSQEKALTTTIKAVARGNVKDHLGNDYKSQKEMCAFYGIPREVFQYRTRTGKTLQDALTKEIQKSEISKKEDVVKDHLGNEYLSITEMCDAYDIPLTNFLVRIRRKWGLERALTEKTTSEIEFGGKVYKNLGELCKEYGISPSTYRNRIKQGMSIEEALSKKPFYDHLGNGYDSLSDMLKAYNLREATYRYRERNGWSLEEILTAEKNARHDGSNIRYIVDHQGKKYKSAVAMCKVYDVRYETYLNRKKQGLSVKECLLGPAKKPRKERATKI